MNNIYACGLLEDINIEPEQDMTDPSKINVKIKVDEIEPRSMEVGNGGHSSLTTSPFSLQISCFPISSALLGILTSFLCPPPTADGPGLDLPDEERPAQDQPPERHPGWQRGDQPREPARGLAITLSVAVLLRLAQPRTGPGLPDVLHGALLRTQHHQEPAGECWVGNECSVWMAG